MGKKLSIQEHDMAVAAPEKPELEEGGSSTDCEAGRGNGY